jgi:hypothetical protein
MRKFGLTAAGFFALAMVFAGVLAPAAQADTVACTGYLTDEGKDTTTRVQICAETETAGDAVSQEYARTVCLPLMSLTGLPKEDTIEACTLAVEP